MGHREKCLRGSIAVMKHHNQRNSRGMGLSSLCFHITVHHQRKSGQKLKQGRMMVCICSAQGVALSEGVALLE